ncbi:MAG TPA: alpha/beta family hydrolase [Xanthobacteraceae bacterium]|jgi:hypothetical protein|nr:alpha/beta family hydrolase [Xanthobacteraceae bacterium]
MPFAGSEPIVISGEDGGTVSGLLQTPHGARAALVLAHGAGAGMNHPFMAAVATGLAERGIASLRYQFPFMERSSKRPDSPRVAQAAVRAAVAAAARALPELPLIAGGKSFGSRMTSQAQATAPLQHFRGLVFFGFPLHPPDRPSAERAAHLSDVKIPMLFLQGTRDAFAELDRLRPVCAALGPLATLTLFEGADHSFHVPPRTGRKDTEILNEVLDAFAAWLSAVCGDAA